MVQMLMVTDQAMYVVSQNKKKPIYFALTVILKGRKGSKSYGKAGKSTVVVDG
jgi:hypothetical protein